MRPGRLSRLGFLGPDERLAEVLARDEATMRDLGLSYTQVAGVLADLLGRAEASPGRRVTVDQRYDVSITVFKGFQLCPWAPRPHRSQCDAAGGPRFASLDWAIRNLRNGQQEHGPGLLAHLIGAHHFFEGEQSPYRVAPASLANLLELDRSGYLVAGSALGQRLRHDPIMPSPPHVKARRIRPPPGPPDHVAAASRAAQNTQLCVLAKLVSVCGAGGTSD